MKILVVASLFAPYTRGGAETMVDSVVHELQRQGHEVSVLTCAPWKGISSLWPRKEEVDGVVVWRFFALNIFSFIHIARHGYVTRLVWHFLDAINVHSYIVVRRFLKRNSFDLVLTHNVKGLGYPVMAAVRKSDLRHIHTMHDVQLVVPSGLLIWGKERILEEPGILTRMFTWWARKMYGSPARVIFPSDFLKRIYAERGFFRDSQISVLANPVPGDLVVSEGGKKKDWSEVVFLYLGQLEEHKGVRFLVDTFNELNDERARLVLAGSGSLSGEMELRAQEGARIECVGRYSRDELGDLLATAHYVVVPSLCYENSPMVIYESFAAGVPVLAAEIGGVAELVEDEQNGYIFKPGDAKGLLHVLHEALGGKNYEDMSDGARASVQGGGVGAYMTKLLEGFKKEA